MIFLIDFFPNLLALWRYIYTDRENPVWQGKDEGIQPSNPLPGCISGDQNWPWVTRPDLAATPAVSRRQGQKNSEVPSGLNYLMVRNLELLFALDFDRVSLSKAIFLECQRNFPNLQMFRWTCSSTHNVGGIQFTWETSQIPHLGATHLTWKRNYYSSLISSKNTSHFPQQLWHLFLLLYLIQTMSHWRSPEGTLALQPHHAVHMLPIKQAQILAALPWQQIWCHLLGWRELETIKLMDCSTQCVSSCLKRMQKLWMSTSLRRWCRNHTPFSQERSHPSPWGDHHLSCLLP